MNTTLRFLSTISIFLLLMAIGFDVVQIRHIKKDMKDSLDLSTKAAAMQIDEDPAKIGAGIFEIDVTKAKKVNKEYFFENVNLSPEIVNLSTDILNTHTKTIYNAPNNKKYDIDSPTIFASAEYHYNGIFLSRDLDVHLLSASVLKNKNDLKR